MYGLYIGLLLTALAVSILLAQLSLRRQRIGAVVQTLASLVSQNLPLVAGVRAAAAAERRALRRIYTRLAQRLALGDDLSTALRLALPACPGEVVGALHGAERGGTLPGVLQSLAARLRRETWQPAVRGMPLWYPVVLLVLLPLVVLFLLVKVVPKFAEIFADFETPLPSITQTLFDFARPLSNYALLIGLGLLVLAGVLVQAMLARPFITRKPDRRQPVYALWDTVVWGLPGLRHLARDRALAQQLLILPAALRAGHDLGEAARQGGCAAVNWHARRRLLRWASLLELGTDPLEAARHLRFPAPFVQALRTAHGEGELAARFEYLADYYQALHQHWLRVLVAACTPLMVVAWALLVGYIVLSLFLPLVVLVQSVMNTID